MNEQGRVSLPPPIRTEACPNCNAAGDHLTTVSANSGMDYYRCERCGHVWAMPKRLR
jgi:DNA-directed RNA polymerase subunit M/transcription elongation factor TFIIS